MVPEWKTYQRNYLDQIEKHLDSSDSDSMDAPVFDIELRQVWLPEMNRADRCVSCHAAIENPGFKTSAHPLKTHPQNYLNSHDPQKYGCTICHDGQGRAVNLRDAKADDPGVFWNKPLLRKPFIEANCYRCHIDLLDQTPSYNQGKQKFETSGCLGCHKRNGKGGLEGPELAGIGEASPSVKHPEKSYDSEISSQFKQNKNLAYIYESVIYPDAQPDDTRMFNFQFSHEQAMELTVYLKGLASRQPGTLPIIPAPEKPLPITELGEKTFHLYCTACHGKNGRGGVKNPNYKNEFIPRLNTMAKQMFLLKTQHLDAVISLLDEYGDLLEAGPQPDITGFFKVVAKYMPVKNIIKNGRIAEKKDNKGSSPLNMPAWEKTLTKRELSAVIAFLISAY